MPVRKTAKQRIIIGLVLEAADRGELLTETELHRRLPYICDYGSLRTSLRFLDRGGIIIRERAGRFCVVRPTSQAYGFRAKE